MKQLRDNADLLGLQETMKVIKSKSEYSGYNQAPTYIEEYAEQRVINKNRRSGSARNTQNFSNGGSSIKA